MLPTIGPEVEVSGQGIQAVLEAFNAFSLLASKIMLEEGLGEEGEDGTIKADPSGWYSLAAYLNAYKKIASQLGDHVVQQVGQAMPKHAKFPPTVVDVPSALSLMDIAYHMNHRLDGKEMFNPQTGERQEGIGHYGFEPVPGQKKAIAVCTNVYPCAFDRGLYEAMVKRFDPSGRVAHDNAKPCRARGGDSCTYIITWNS